MDNRLLWSLSATIALAVHAGAIVYYANTSLDAPSPPPVGQKGVLVELAFEGAAAGGISQAGNTQEISEHQLMPDQAAPKKTTAHKPQEEKQSEPEPLPERPIETPHEPELAEEVPKEPEQAEVPVEAEETPPEEEETVDDPDIVEPKTAPAQKTATPSLQQAEAIHNLVGEESGEAIPAVTNSIGGAGGSNAEAKGNEGDGSAAQSGGMGGVIRTYEDLVRVWVQKNLVYPRMARERRLMGTVTVRFMLDSSGNVLNAEIAEESGYRILNKSALKTIKRASPFPTFPDEMNSMKDHTFLIPIEFGVN